MRLVLVRHGQTSSNIRGALDTAAPGPGLTALGMRQAAALPAALREWAVEGVYASTLLRARQTAAPTAHAFGLPVQVRPGLREITAGSLEMADDDDSVETYLRIVLGWADGAVGVRMPGATDDGHAVLGRFDEVVEEVVETGVETAVLVSHGAMIRVWSAARCADVTVGFVARNVVPNTGLVVVTGRPGRWSLERWPMSV